MTSAGLVGLLCIATSLFLFFTVREVVGKFDWLNNCLSISWRIFLDVIPTNQTSFLKGLSMIMCYPPFLILTVATVASILATQVSIDSYLSIKIILVRLWFLVDSKRVTVIFDSCQGRWFTIYLFSIHLNRSYSNYFPTKHCRTLILFFSESFSDSNNDSFVRLVRNYA